ncbi:hypothetical protein ACVIW0_007473 [Bradyrhizobium sp. USDA 4454]
MEAERDGKYAAERKAQRKLQLLPARKENCFRVAKSWNGLAATYLTRRALIGAPAILTIVGAGLQTEAVIKVLLAPASLAITLALLLMLLRILVLPTRIQLMKPMRRLKRRRSSAAGPRPW